MMPIDDTDTKYCPQHDEALVEGLCGVCYDIDRRSEDRDD